MSTWGSRLLPFSQAKAPQAPRNEFRQRLRRAPADETHPHTQKHALNGGGGGGGVW